MNAHVTKAPPARPIRALRAGGKSASIVTMTPEWAQRLLDNNPTNRPLSKNAVSVIARDMAAGNFRLNGDAIRVAADGELADGQHRLAACVKAGVPFQTFFVEGLSKEDTLTLDRGRPRAVGDNLAIAFGIPNARLVAATLRNLVMYAQQDMGATPTAAELKTLLDLHPGVALSAQVSASGVQPARPSLIAAFHYIGYVTTGNLERSNAFVNVFKTGVPDYEGDAAHALRELLMREKVKKVRGTELRHYSLFACAWNKFVNQTPVKTARPMKEGFRVAGWDKDALTSPVKDREPELV